MSASPLNVTSLLESPGPVPGMPPQKVMELTVGAALIGVIIASAFYGISVIQTYIYFIVKPSETPRERHDDWCLKSLAGPVSSQSKTPLTGLLQVGSVFVFDTIHQVFICHTSTDRSPPPSFSLTPTYPRPIIVYTYLVLDAGDPLALNTVVWSLLAEVLFNGLIGFLVQSFLTLRVWRLSKHSFWLTAPAFLLVLAEFAPRLTPIPLLELEAFGIKALVSVRTFADLATMKWLSILVNALAAAGDVYITGSLSFLLHRSRTGFQRSDAIITRLIHFTVNTGLLTTCCAVGSLISILAAPTTFIYIAFFFTIGRLYANSLMCTLNARSYIRNSGDDYNSTNSHMFCSRDLPTMGSAMPTRIAGGISIHVDTMHKYDNDRDLEKGGQEQVEMSPVGRSKSGRDDRSSDEIEHGHGVSFCEMEDSEDIEKVSTIQPPQQCFLRQEHGITA
ncbi:hypothetical protein PQX77_008730 [Marasmius sp. AFHP31]|nr:hypothetical protein PQX77_008730 [Marasmius sp. AFHP31]